MANIRCQMCGKENEEHLEECKHCGARLKPLIAPHMRPEQTAPEESEPEKPPGEEGDWLQSLRLDDDADLAEESEPAESSFGGGEEEEEEEIDFISQMRGGEDLVDTADLDEVEEEGPHDDAFDDLPDWLSGEGEPGSQFQEEQESEAEGDSDFLSFETEEPEGELPDWLTEMGEAGGEEVESEPDFDFQGMESAGSEEGTEPPDWLSDLGDEQEEFELPEEPEEAAEAEGSPDWMADFGEAEAEGGPAEFDFEAMEPEEGAEAPDWLSELGDEQEEFELPEEPEEAAGAEGSPDWMADFGEAEAEGEPVEFDFEGMEPESPEGEEEIPEWLHEFSETEMDVEKPSEGEFEPSEELPKEEALPDWLGEVGELDVEAPPSYPSEPRSEEAPEEDLPPDWSADFDIEEEIEEEIEAEPAEAADSTPDWLADLASEEPDKEISKPFTTGMLEGEHIDEDMLESTTEGQVPDWLQELEGESADIPIETEGEVEWQPGEELASWEPEETPEAYPSEVEGERELEKDLDALPEWLQAEMETSETKRATEPDTGEGELAPGEIPEWVAALKPSTTPFETRPASEREAGEVERAGPLAGLRDVLPAEPEIAQTGKPPAYSIKLGVSEAQQRNVKLLLGMMAAEDAPRSIPKPQVLTQQRILRWVIGLGLFLAVLLPILAGTQIAPMPALPPETDAVENLIAGLGENAPVLLAFDYEPGTLGELDAASAAVVNHLMEKNAFITLVSTSPMGPALGERFLREVQGSHNYEYASDYANLGYISGGAAGLLNFAIAPQETVFLPYDNRFLLELTDLQANNAWALSPLENVEALSDFDLTLVITDDPDVARNWVEQVEPALRENAFMLIVSAQAEPLVRPYFETPQRQVNGLVTGLAGGAAYEQERGQMNLGRTYWDAFGVSLVVAQVLILIGGIFNLGAALFNRGRKTDV